MFYLRLSAHQMDTSQHERMNLPGGREVVLGHVEDFGFEDFSCLLSNSLSQKLVVHLDSRHVTSVAWDDCCFPLTWALSQLTKGN